MMNALKNLFRAKTPAEKPMDPQVAAAALLVEAALSDGVYVNMESDVIAEILLEACCPCPSLDFSLSSCSSISKLLRKTF